MSSEAYYVINRLLISSIKMFISAMEIIGQKSRTGVGLLVQAVYALGYMTLSGFSVYWRDWRSLQRAIALVPLVFPFLWILLPKSPRYNILYHTIIRFVPNRRRIGNQTFISVIIAI